MSDRDPSPEQVRRALDGVAPDQVPIACSKRLTIARETGGRLYRIGRVAPSRAFVLMLGDLRLIYVATDYRNYRRLAVRMHEGVDARIDYDHALGRRLAEAEGIRYVLLLRLDRGVNRSHGGGERPLSRTAVCLRKIFHFDERIFDKCLGYPLGHRPIRTRGYLTGSRHHRVLSDEEWVRFGSALGVGHLKADLSLLRAIDR